MLIGLLVYKPQFGLLIPLVLIVSGRWRTFTAAALTVVLLALAVTLAFGPEVWSAFLASTKFTRTVVLEQGGTGWHKIQSVFSVVRMWGGSVPLAYALQSDCDHRRCRRARLAVAIARKFRVQGRRAR